MRDECVQLRLENMPPVFYTNTLFCVYLPIWCVFRSVRFRCTHHRILHIIIAPVFSLPRLRDGVEGGLDLTGDFAVFV